MSRENLEIVHAEVSELLRTQQDGINLLYNKLNWILVSDVVLLVTVTSLKCVNPIVSIILILSVIITLIGFSPERFKVTAKISDQIRLYENDTFLKSLIEKKKQAYLANNKRINNVHSKLKWASFCLVVALIVQFMLTYV